MSAKHTDLKALLDLAHDRYNQPAFISEDPIQIPHSFEKKEDIEISGFLAALIAWGRRPMIIRNAHRLMELMEHAPHDFVMHASEDELARLEPFVHRTFNGEDAKAMVRSLRMVYREKEGLEGVFSSAIKPEHPDVYQGIVSLHQLMTQPDWFTQRTYKHLANPAKGSAAKRLNMYLRWMVRQDKRGVDFGLWKGIRPSQLLCPLDVHTGNVARQLGLLHRKQNDWKAVVELTESLRTFCPEDPVKYDFSLFSIGIHKDI